MVVTGVKPGGWHTNSMEQSPSSKVNIHSDGQEIHCLLWNPKVHYFVHKNLQSAYYITI
jgi:hypothetical protein